MNCDPGDLAMVVRATSSNACCRALIGRCVIKCKTPVFMGEWYWEPEDGPVPCPIGPFCRFELIADSTLQRLRGDKGKHPGDVLVTPHEKASDPILHPAPSKTE